MKGNSFKWQGTVASIFSRLAGHGKERVAVLLPLSKDSLHRYNHMDIEETCTNRTIA
jgi:hypothetical protein